MTHIFHAHGSTSLEERTTSTKVVSATGEPETSLRGLRARPPPKRILSPAAAMLSLPLEPEIPPEGNDPASPRTASESVARLVPVMQPAGGSVRQYAATSTSAPGTGRFSIHDATGHDNFDMIDGPVFDDGIDRRGIVASGRENNGGNEQPI